MQSKFKTFEGAVTLQPTPRLEARLICHCQVMATEASGVENRAETIFGEMSSNKVLQLELVNKFLSESKEAVSL